MTQSKHWILICSWADQCGDFRDKDHQIPGFQVSVL
jgi:hypothetical protein